MASCKVIGGWLQGQRAAADATVAELRLGLESVGEDVRTNAQADAALQARVTKLREEVVALVTAEADARGDSVATLRAALEGGLKQCRADLDKVANSVQVRSRCQWVLLSSGISMVPHAGRMQVQGDAFAALDKRSEATRRALGHAEDRVAALETRAGEVEEKAATTSQQLADRAASFEESLTTQLKVASDGALLPASRSC